MKMISNESNFSEQKEGDSKIKYAIFKNKSDSSRDSVKAIVRMSSTEVRNIKT